MGFVNTESNERTYWMPLNEVSSDTFTLAIDKKVGAMLKILNDTSGR